MGPIHLFDLAAQQSRWLAISQSAIANNVANANTPGYQAQSVRPFSELLDKTQLQLASTDGQSLALTPFQTGAVTTADEDSWETTESGNSVSLEQEMIKAGDVRRDYTLNTNVVHAFHSMLLSAVKS